MAIRFWISVSIYATQSSVLGQRRNEGHNVLAILLFELDTK